MDYFPAEIWLHVVKHLRYAFGDPEGDQNTDHQDYLKQLGHLRLVSRVLAESLLVKQILFKHITFRISHRATRRLEQTYRTIGPYIQTLTFESSLFDSSVTKEQYCGVFRQPAYASGSDDIEGDLLRSYEKYYARALQDEAVEDEIKASWQQWIRSFHALERINIRDGMWYNGIEAAEHERFSIHAFLLHWPTMRHHRLVDVINEHCGSRLYKLIIPLLRGSGLQVKSLRLQGHVGRPDWRELRTEPLLTLTNLELSWDLIGAEDVEPALSGETVPMQELLLALTSGRRLLNKCLEASQESLEELSLLAKPKSPLWWEEETFSSNIRCNRLRNLNLDRVCFTMESTLLISAIMFKFPNLERLSVSDSPGEGYDDADDGFWPNFLRELREAVRGRKFKVEGHFRGKSSTLYFAPTLNVPYTRALKAFQEKKCNHRTALSVAIRQYIDGAASWQLFINTVDNLQENRWLGECDGDTDYFESEEEEGLETTGFS